MKQSRTYPSHSFGASWNQVNQTKQEIITTRTTQHQETNCLEIHFDGFEPLPLLVQPVHGTSAWLYRMAMAMAMTNITASQPSVAMALLVLLIDLASFGQHQGQRQPLAPPQLAG